MKQLTILLLAGFSLLLSPCEGVGQDKKKVALVSFKINKKIDTGNLGNVAKASSKLLEGMTNLINDPNFNLEPILENFSERFFKEYAPEFPFELLPETEVIENPDYVNYNSISSSKFFTPLKNYKNLASAGIGKNLDAQNMIELFKDKASGVMFIDMYYSFEPVGMGKFTVGTRVVCWVSMRLWSTEGKQKQVFLILEGDHPKM